MNQQEYIKELRDALQALVDVQNGPPLIERTGEWTLAMNTADRLLAIEPPAEKPKRYGCKSDPRLPLEECVIFTDPGQCTLAARLLSEGKTREDCPYWREIKKEG